MCVGGELASNYRLDCTEVLLYRLGTNTQAGPPTLLRSVLAGKLDLKDQATLCQAVRESATIRIKPHVQNTFIAVL